MKHLIDVIDPGYIIFWGREGPMSHEVAVRNIDLLTQEVIPALREYEAQREGTGMSEESPGNPQNNGAPVSCTDVAVTIRARPAQAERPGVDAGDAAELAETYRDGLNQYREHSLRYLAAGDYRQAAEKSWGAYAQSVNSRRC